jgi:alpha-amylase
MGLNGTMLQAFHWYSPGDGTVWTDLSARAPQLAAAGFTALWLPPASKGMSGALDVGYGTYDLYDLGEFDQKGSIRTKYGTRAEYLRAIQAARAVGLQVYADTVLNHRLGGDAIETTRATPFAREDRFHATGPQREVDVHTHFSFPGRRPKHSDFEWHWRHFDAVDWDERTRDGSSVYLLDGKRFDDQVGFENGNYAFLLGCDVDFESAEVRDEIERWGKWYLDTTGADGFRLDALKHISAWFFPVWLDSMERHAGKDLFVVGEYWTPDLGALHGYLDAMGGRMAVFDVPLHFNFHRASTSGGYFDMRKILEGTLMQQRPTQAVTFVDNHDSQPLQALESVVEPWFKPLAYALILLRAEGYPCVFQADYAGADYEDWGRDGHRYRVQMASHRFLIDKFLHARRYHAHGPQYDYFDHENCIGWTRLGDAAHPRAMAVLMSDGPAGNKWMEVGRRDAAFVDITGHVPEPVRTNADGWGEFRCNGGSVSVWVQE